MKKKDSVLELCGLPLNTRPEEIFSNAGRIHDYLEETKGINTVWARMLLFGWASKELNIELKEFKNALMKGNANSFGYKKMEKSSKKIHGITMTIIIFWFFISHNAGGLSEDAARGFLIQKDIATWLSLMCLFSVSYLQLWTKGSFFRCLIMNFFKKRGF